MIEYMLTPATVQTASIGIPDTMLLMLLALMVFGPRRLPEIGRQIGKLMYEFRKISNDFKYQMEEELRANEEIERQRKLSANTSPETSLHIPPPEPAFATPPESTEVQTQTEPVETPPESAPQASEALRGEPRRFPSIHPPAAGHVVPRAFRGLIPEPPEAATVTSPEEAVVLAPDLQGNPAGGDHV